jgi:L-fuculose-phosphate aldolase
VAAAARKLGADELVIGAAGNVSARVEDRLAVTAMGTSLATVASQQVLITDLSGVVLRPERAPASNGAASDEGGSALVLTSEFALHAAIYGRFGAGAVVHTHPPYGTALACVLRELPVVHYLMLTLGGPIRVAPYVPFGTAELAQVTADALQDRSAALMANHGAIAYGPTLDEAIERAVLLEWLCTLYWRAASIGAPRTLTAEEQDDARERLTERARLIAGDSRHIAR